MDHRRRVLGALGVTAYRLRRRFQPAGALQPDAAAADGAAGPACALVLPAGCDVRQSRLLARILAGLGPAFARAPRVEVATDDLQAPPPQADVYLAFGTAQQQALGRGLPAASHAQVVPLDAPAALFDAGAKRRLWQAVRALRSRAGLDAEA